MNEPSPGPWEWAYSNDTGPEDDYFIEFFEVTSGYDVVARVDREADARLIAAAPDLLEALQLADAMLSGANMNASVVEKKVRAAIAKATTGDSKA